MGAGRNLPTGQGTGEALAHPVPAGAKARCFLWEAAAQAVRVVGTPDQPWFVAKDVCAALGIANYRDAVESLDDDEKGVALTDTLGGAQEMVTVNESGLYALIFRSRKDQARLFRKWVTSEVLPVYRKTGQYQAPAALPLPQYPDLAHRQILIQESFTPPAASKGEEQLVYRLLAEVYHYTGSYSRSAALVHGHTICDIARRENTFGPWFGAHRSFQGTARFMKNLSRFFNRPLHQARPDIDDNLRDCTTISTMSIRPEGHGRHRRYVITSGQVALPHNTVSRVLTAEAVAIVSAAISSGKEVTVK